MVCQNGGPTLCTIPEKMYWKHETKNRVVFSEFSTFDFSVSNCGGMNLEGGQLGAQVKRTAGAPTMAGLAQIWSQWVVRVCKARSAPTVGSKFSGWRGLQLVACDKGLDMDLSIPLSSYQLMIDHHHQMRSDLLKIAMGRTKNISTNKN